MKRHAYHIRACASSSLQNSVLPPPSLEVENYFCKDCNLIHCSHRRRVRAAKGKWGEREIETWVKKILSPARSPLDFTWMTEIQLSPAEPMAMTLLYTLLYRERTDEVRPATGKEKQACCRSWFKGFRSCVHLLGTNMDKRSCFFFDTGKFQSMQGKLAPNHINSFKKIRTWEDS